MGLLHQSDIAPASLHAARTLAFEITSNGSKSVRGNSPLPILGYDMIMMNFCMREAQNGVRSRPSGLAFHWFQGLGSNSAIYTSGRSLRPTSQYNFARFHGLMQDVSATDKSYHNMCTATVGSRPFKMNAFSASQPPQKFLFSVVHTDFRDHITYQYCTTFQVSRPSLVYTQQRIVPI